MKKLMLFAEDILQWETDRESLDLLHMDRYSKGLVRSNQDCKVVELS